MTTWERWECYVCGREVVLPGDGWERYPHLLCSHCRPQYTMAQYYSLFEEWRLRDAADGVPPGIVYTVQFRLSDGEAIPIDEVDKTPDQEMVVLVHIRYWSDTDLGDVETLITFADALDMTLDEMLEKYPALAEEDYDEAELQEYRDQLTKQVDEVCSRLDPDRSAS